MQIAKVDECSNKKGQELYKYLRGKSMGGFKTREIHVVKGFATASMVGT